MVSGSIPELLPMNWTSPSVKLAWTVLGATAFRRNCFRFRAAIVTSIFPDRVTSATSRTFPAFGHLSHQKQGVIVWRITPGACIIAVLQPITLTISVFSPSHRCQMMRHKNFTALFRPNVIVLLSPTLSCACRCAQRPGRNRLAEQSAGHQYRCRSTCDIRNRHKPSGHHQP